MEVKIMMIINENIDIRIQMRYHLIKGGRSRGNI